MITNLQNELRPLSKAHDTRVTGVRRWLGFVAAMQIAGFLGIFVKYVYLNLSMGFLTIGRIAGNVATDGLTFAEQLYFFREDVLLDLIVLPVVLSLLVCWLLPRRAAGVMAAILAAFLALFHFIGLTTVSTVGQFISWNLFREGLQWFISHPESGPEYVSTPALIKLVAIILTSTAAAIVAAARSTSTTLHFARLLFGSGAAVTLVLAPTVYAVHAPESLSVFPQRRAGTIMQVDTLIQRNPVSSLSDLPRQDLYRRYKALVSAPDCPNRDDFLGTEQGKDVIFFVYETGPRRSFDIAMERGWLPALDSLQSQSFVAENHFSTFPYTSDALFSIFTGRYPINRRILLKTGRADISDSLTQRMKSNGYSFNVYESYGDVFEADSAMFNTLGASTVYSPDSADLKRQLTNEHIYSVLDTFRPQSQSYLTTSKSQVTDRLVHDLAGFQRFTNDIKAFKAKKKPFVAVYLPQIGHAPWFDFDGTPEVVERGAAAMRIQDQWLGTLLAQLRDRNELKDTVIVVTADHGVRTTTEDPGFKRGLLGRYTFHVPLLIYAPNAVPRGMHVQSVTSHIDIASTIATLIAVPLEPAATQGSPIWCSDISQRATFLFADEYLGANGYHLGNTYVMHDILSDAIYTSKSLDFHALHLAGPTESVRQRQFIQEMRQIAYAWNSAPLPTAD